jgi:TetR/AcrR family transcriptional regulator, transcriptional repressor for nem operon
MRRTAEQSAHTRRRILAEAVRSLREGGARSVRVARVMHDAGLTHGGFYAHFPSRDALLGEAIAQLAAESAPMKRLARQPDAPALALADFLEHYLSTAHCERRPGACPLPILLPDADVLAPEARATTWRLVSRLTDRLGEILGDLGRACPHGDATRLLAEAIGRITLARAEPDRSLREEHLARAREELWAAYGAMRPPQEDQAPTAPRSREDRSHGAAP